MIICHLHDGISWDDWLTTMHRVSQKKRQIIDIEVCACHTGNEKCAEFNLTLVLLRLNFGRKKIEYFYRLLIFETACNT